MKCLVCPSEFDHERPIVADPEHLKLNISQVDAEVLARRKRASEQSEWQFVQLMLGGKTVVQGHVCPAHANAESLTLNKVVGK